MKFLWSMTVSYTWVLIWNCCWSCLTLPYLNLLSLLGIQHDCINVLISSTFFRFSCKFFLLKRLYFIMLPFSHFDPVASLNTPLTADFHTPVVTGSWVHSSRRGFARFSSCQLDHVRDGRVGQLPGCYKRPRSGRVLLAEDTRVYLHLRYAWPVSSAIYAWSDKLAYKLRRCTCYVALF